MKRLLSVLLAVVLLCCTVTPAISAADKKPDYQKTKITAHLFDEDDPAELDCLIRSDLPTIPYLSAADFLDQILTEKVRETDKGGGVFTISNGEYDMVIDTEKDTLHFDDVSSFFSENAKPYLDDEKAEYLKEDEEETLIGEMHSLDIDLSKYGIDITVSDGRVYFPFCTLNDLTCNNYRLVKYHNGELTFYQGMTDEFLYGSPSDDIEEYSEETAEYIYNELCFTVDYTYGCPSMAKIAGSIEKNGFDKALETYDEVTAKARELLRSTSRADFSTGLSLLQPYMFDGGHTDLTFSSLAGLANIDYDDVGELIGDLFSDPDKMDLSAILDSQSEAISRSLITMSMESEKRKAYQDFKLIKMWDSAELYEKDGTYFFDFDEFTDKVVQPFKDSLDIAAENKAKNFVIDLTTNSGGAVAVVIYMLSLMCGDYSLREIDMMTGNLYELNAQVDKNLDGEFDKKDDKVKYDFHFAILTSQSSFSSANMLPGAAQDSGIAILGENSGGGACNIVIHMFPDGTVYSLSGSYKIIHKNGEDVDTGAHPDVVLSGKDEEYAGFYDIARINEGIDQFYKGELEKPTAAPTQAATEKPTEAATETETQAVREKVQPNDNNIVPYIIIGCAALIVILLIVIVIIIFRRRKKNQDIPM